MASGDQELTHDEIWDDSALIDSWDQALQEYKVTGIWPRDAESSRKLMSYRNITAFTETAAT